MSSKLYTIQLSSEEICSLQFALNLAIEIQSERGEYQTDLAELRQRTSQYYARAVQDLEEIERKDRPRGWDCV